MAAALTRLSLYLFGNQYVWQLLFADDFERVVRGPNMFDNLLLVVFWQTVMGVPFAWQKFAGGTKLEWVGYWLDYQRFAMDISVNRTRWLRCWIEETLRTGGVLIGTLEEVLGRIGFAANALGHIRSWLGPLFAWCVVMSGGAYLQLPVMIKLILTMMAEVMRDGAEVAPLREIAEGKQVLLR